MPRTTVAIAAEIETVSEKLTHALQTARAFTQQLNTADSHATLVGVAELMVVAAVDVKIRAKRLAELEHEMCVAANKFVNDWLIVDTSTGEF